MREWPCHGACCVMLIHSSWEYNTIRNIDIYWHLLISTNIYWHLLTSIDIYWHLLTPIDIYWHQYGFTLTSSSSLDTAVHSSCQCNNNQHIKSSFQWMQSCMGSLSLFLSYMYTYLTLAVFFSNEHVSNLSMQHIILLYLHGTTNSPKGTINSSPHTTYNIQYRFFYPPDEHDK